MALIPSQIAICIALLLFLLKQEHSVNSQAFQWWYCTSDSGLCS